jgi:hypothetical protein
MRCNIQKNQKIICSKKILIDMKFLKFVLNSMIVNEHQDYNMK